MDDTALGRIEHAEGKWAAAFANLLGGEACHRLQFGFASLPETVSITDEPMLAFEAPAMDLEKDGLESVKHLAVFHKREANIAAAEIEQTAFADPTRCHLEVKSEVADDLGQKLFCFLTGFVHNNYLDM